MELIDKAAVMAEIERLRALLPDANDCDCLQLEFARGQQDAFTDFEEFIRTSKVKEVDLEEEFESFAYTLPHSAIGDGEHLGKFDDPKVKEARKHGWSHLWRYSYVKKIAKHFFELGLKAKNWKKERMEECPYRQVGCTMYEGHILECKGACSWVVDYPKLKELKAQKGE